MLRLIHSARAFFLLSAALLLPATTVFGTSFPVDFQKEILPIFQSACAACHLGDAAMGKLRLSSETEILRGGASGPAIVVGKSSESLLIKRVLGVTDAPRMPMGGGQLSPEQVRLIRQWIDGGNFSARAQLGSAANVNDNGPGHSSPIFASQVRPILAARCYSCHGPDLQQNGLRLDSLAAILKGSDSGRVVVPGKADASRLVRRLMAQERPQMPYGGPPLSASETATIREWIDAGAPGPDSSTPLASAKQMKHWAYVKPVRPEIPQVKDVAWGRNPVDSFVLARLEEEGLKPSAEADKRTLIRRVYLDLIGLPPTPEDVDAFLGDDSPSAYEKVVDRLQASPRYGERWARPWLDLARYADSNGYEKDRRRIAWPYRDWVIRSLNEDKSFRDFTIEQIAGDMLPKPTTDQLVATGFNRNSMLNQEGGIDIEEYYWYSLVDRVNTTASVWLGSTLGCAQCHNHKFDPFTQKDYYRFLAFYSNGEHAPASDGDHWMSEPELPLPTPEQDKENKAFEVRIALLKARLTTQTPQLDLAQKAWESQIQAAESDWSPLKLATYESAGGAEMKALQDGSVLAEGKNPQADTYKIVAQTSLLKLTAIRLEVLPDPSLPHNGPGRDPDGNFFLSDFDVVLKKPTDSRVETVVWRSAKADENQDGYDIKKIVNKKAGQLVGWAIEARDDAAGRRQAVFTPDEPLDIPSGSTLTITLKHEMRHSSRNIGRFRLSATSSSDPEFIIQVPAQLRPLLSLRDRSPEQARKLAAAYRDVAPSLKESREELSRLKKDVEKLGIATALVMEERPSYTRPAAYLRERGTFTSPGELVYADVPSALGHLPTEAMPNRLGLAQWLVSDDNPLTARVTVNHFWETIFGRGIVETSEDFGSQGDPPTHPELLDWLATEFMQNGWSMKKIQKLMVMSATYRQRSAVTPELTARDPYNKLYARGPRFRMESEMVHDLALSLGGLLSDKMYGTSVFPYQPDGVWDIPYNSDKWIQSEGADRFRRAIYTFMRRSAPYPSLATFDAPSREFCTVRRVRTNTPLQALTGLNDPLFFTAARALAKRMVARGNTVPDHIRYGFEIAVSRPPSKGELESVAKFYAQQLAAYNSNSETALKTIANVDHALPNASELAAMTMVANVLINMDETVTKE